MAFRALILAALALAADGKKPAKEKYDTPPQPAPVAAVVGPED